MSENNENATRNLPNQSRIGTKYQKIDNDKRREIIKYWEDNNCSMTYDQMATNTGVKRSSFNNIIKIYQRTGRAGALERGGSNHSRIPEEQIQAIKDQLESNPSVTLGELRQHLIQSFDLRSAPSISGIDSILKTKVQYILKRIEKYPQKANDLETRNLRKAYIDMLLVDNIHYNNNCIFFDNSDFNLWITQGKARSRADAPAFKSVISQRKRNISVIAAMSVNGVEYISVNNMLHGADGPFFAECMNQLYLHLDQIKAPNQTIIMEYASIHQASEVQSVMKEHPRHKVIFLPPYSPFLNPIEELFSKVKSFIKREYLEDTPALLREIEQGLKSVSVVDCAEWISRSSSYFSPCQRMEEIL